MEKSKNASKDNSDISDLKQKQQVLERRFSAAVMHSGPLPPPEQLSKYDAIVENGAERIFAMAEKEQMHRHKIAETAIRGELKYLTKGQNWGVAIGFFGIIAGALLVVLGHDVAGCTLFTVCVGGLAITFVTGKNQK